jgi:hypothetical protein
MCLIKNFEKVRSRKNCHKISVMQGKSIVMILRKHEDINS